MNKNYLLFTIAAVFALSFVMPTFAQESKMSSDDVLRTVGRAERKLENTSYKCLMTVEWFTERDGTSTSRDTDYFATLQPDDYHMVAENAAARIETVVKGDKTYRRLNDSDWISVAVSPASKRGNAGYPTIFGEGPNGMALSDGTGKFIARGTIDAREVAMYEILTIRKDSKSGTVLRMDTTQYWVNNIGQLVRKQIEQDLPGDKRFMRSVTDYQYTDIQIDAPILPYARPY